jgi:hypothetical protein
MLQHLQDIPGIEGDDRLQRQIFETHQLAVDPQRGAGVGKMASFDLALPDR